MKSVLPIKALFIDIGGVLLTNGWGHESRQRAAEVFDLDLTEMNDRHHLTVETYEEGKLTLEEYLTLVVFYRKRTFTRLQFQKFMFEQSKPYPLMIELISKLKAQFGLKIAVVSNEAREINSHRIQAYKLDGFVDFFVSSCFVHLRKPDKDIYRLALDLAQVPADQIVYIDDRAMFVQIAEAEGIRSIHHTDYESTRKQLALLGLEIAEEGIRQA
jgi:putative hydrolase of the HAD superfamily